MGTSYEADHERDEKDFLVMPDRDEAPMGIYHLVEDYQIEITPHYTYQGKSSRARRMDSVRRQIPWGNIPQVQWGMMWKVVTP